MKVFISHKKEDADKAREIASRLHMFHSIDSYLDVIDPLIGRFEGPELAEHVLQQMETCDSLLAVVSRNTASSQWVPWEIGIATEKGFPLATFADGVTLLPEFLQKWPYLTSNAELDKYANRVTQLGPGARTAILKRSYSAENFKTLNASARKTASDFYRDLRRDLGR